MPYMKMTCRAGKTKEIAKYYTYWLQPEGRKRSPRVNDSKVLHLLVTAGGEEEESKGKPYHRAAAENK